MQDAQGHLANLVSQDSLGLKVTEENQWMFLVHLENGGLVEPWDSQASQDPQVMMESLVSSELQVQKDPEEVQVTKETQVQQVWLAPLVLVDVVVLRVPLVELGLLVLLENMAVKDSKVLLDRWVFMDWMDLKERKGTWEPEG